VGSALARGKVIRRVVDKEGMVISTKRPPFFYIDLQRTDIVISPLGYELTLPDTFAPGGTATAVRNWTGKVHKAPIGTGFWSAVPHGGYYCSCDQYKNTMARKISRKTCRHIEELKRRLNSIPVRKPINASSSMVQAFRNVIPEVDETEKNRNGIIFGHGKQFGIIYNVNAAKSDIMFKPLVEFETAPVEVYWTLHWREIANYFGAELGREFVPVGTIRDVKRRGLYSSKLIHDAVYLLNPKGTSSITMFIPEGDDTNLVLMNERGETVLVTATSGGDHERFSHLYEFEGVEGALGKKEYWTDNNKEIVELGRRHFQGEINKLKTRKKLLK